jgi:hypothetical protein
MCAKTSGEGNPVTDHSKHSKYGPTTQEIPISLEPTDGFHCSHFFYSWDRGLLQELSEHERKEAADEFCGLFGPVNNDHGGVAGAGDSRFQDWPTRTQLGLVAGAKADFSLMVLDKDPLRIEDLHQSILASQFGPCLVPVDCPKSRNTSRPSNNLRISCSARGSRRTRRSSKPESEGTKNACRA